MNMKSHRYPPDEIEGDIADVTTARMYLHRHHTAVLETVRRRRGAFLRLFGEQHNEMAQKTYGAGLICLARMAGRLGTTADQHYNYHDELHPIDLLDHMLILLRSDEALRITPPEWMYLFIFSAAHDLRQGFPGYDANGVGNNERASADEAIRILELAGFNREEDFPMFDVIEWMIHGTTFLLGEMELGGGIFGPGALAPRLAEKIQPMGESFGPLSNDQVCELVLLAADIDTANVAQPIDQFAEQSESLCREFHKLQGISLNSADSGKTAFGFLTRGQEQYFFNSQRFNSRLARAALNESKNRTGEQLRELIAWLEERFTDELENQPDLNTGEHVLQAFLGHAIELEIASGVSFRDQDVEE